MICLVTIHPAESVMAEGILVPIVENGIKFGAMPGEFIVAIEFAKKSVVAHYELDESSDDSFRSVILTNNCGTHTYGSIKENVSSNGSGMGNNTKGASNCDGTSL